MRNIIFVLLLVAHASASAFTGQLKSTTDDYPYHLGPPTVDVVPYLTLDVGDKYKFTKSFRFQWKLFALSNLESKYPPEKLYGDVSEAFFEYKTANTKWRIGANTVNWGIVDISSPSDTVNTLALFHPLRTRKQGAPMVEAVLGPEAINLDLIYIPVKRRPELPSKDSRWLPRQFLTNIQTAEGEVFLPPFIEYEYDRAVTLDNALNNNYGAKLAAHLGSWDLQITHFEGAAPSPKVIPTIEFDTNPQIIARSPIHLAPLTYRVRTTGFGFVWAREKWIFRGESAYQHTISKNELLQPWSWTSVVAAETNVPIGSTTLTLLAQIYYSKNPQAADNLISSSYRLFDRTGVLGARYAYSESLTVILSALYETETKGVFAMLGFDNKLSEHLRWGLSWRNFSAPEPGLIKTFEKNSHGTLDLTYFF